MKILTYNIYHSRQATGKFEPFSQAARLREIIDYVKQVGAQVVCLQEVHENHLRIFHENFGLDYTLFETRHSSRGGCCFLVTMVAKPMLGPLKRVYHDSPAFINEYKGAKKLVQCISVVSVGEIAIVNAHMPMAADLRFAGNQVLIELSGKHEQIVVMGDMNTFADMRGDEQIKELVDAGFEHSCLGVETTFQPLPYDVLPEGAKLCVLDHVFTRGRSAAIDNQARPPLLAGGMPGDRKDRWLSDHLPTQFFLENPHEQ